MNVKVGLFHVFPLALIEPYPQRNANITGTRRHRILVCAKLVTNNGSYSYRIALSC
jgi:hypothetical protein